MIYYDRVIFHSTQRPKKKIWGPLLDKTALQNRTNKRIKNRYEQNVYVSSKTAD